MSSANRREYLSRILSGLEGLQSKLGTPDAESVAKGVLSTMLELINNQPRAPFSEVVAALYDAMSYQELWRTYTAVQYGRAITVFRTLPTDTISKDNVEKAIASLEESGFDTTPIECTA